MGSWHVLGFVCFAAGTDSLCACPAAGCFKPGLRARLAVLGTPGGGESAGAFRVLFLGAFLGAFFPPAGGRCPARRRLAKGDCHFLRAQGALCGCSLCCPRDGVPGPRRADSRCHWLVAHPSRDRDGQRTPAVSDHPSTALAAGRAPKYMLLLLYPPAVALIRHRTRSIVLLQAHAPRRPRHHVEQGGN